MWTCPLRSAVPAGTSTEPESRAVSTASARSSRRCWVYRCANAKPGGADRERAVQPRDRDLARVNRRLQPEVPERLSPEHLVLAVDAHGGLDERRVGLAGLIGPAGARALRGVAPRQAGLFGHRVHQLVQREAVGRQHHVPGQRIGLQVQRALHRHSPGERLEIAVQLKQGRPAFGVELRIVDDAACSSCG